MLLVVALAATKGPIVFGYPGQWFVFSRAGEELASYTTLGGLEARDAAISPDGKTFVFTSWNATAQNPLLYKWQVGTPDAVLLGSPLGFHANPTFTDDGKWVYFAHHPRKGGPPGQHEPGANAQLYRVKVDGTQLEALTSESGCHMQPAIGRGTSVAFSHADCRAGRSIELTLVSRLSPSPLRKDYGAFSWPAFHPSERRIAYISVSRVDAAVVEQELRTSTSREVFRFENYDDNTRLAYANDGYLFQTSLGVYSYQADTGTRLLVSFGRQR